ncbi:MAG: hypothetical protein L0Z54_06665 [Thermoplasmata archaeon]|nr:hypothetical protein [Thermoplasmata archaeon]
MVRAASKGGSVEDEPSVCAICKKAGTDFSHTCDAQFHRECLEQYRKFIGSSDTICPHCLEKVSYEPRGEDVEFYEEAQAPMELLAQQYLDLSNEYYLELINNDMYYVRAFVTNMDPESGIWHMYPLTINYTNYPDRPRMMIPEDVLTDALDLSDTIGLLRGWDSRHPPTVVELVKSVESAITDKNRLYEEIEALEQGEGASRNGDDRLSFEYITYGGRTMAFSLDLQNYPDAPDMVMEGLCIGKGFNTIKNWERRTSALGDVVREIKDCMMHHYRREYEREALSRYFEVTDNDGLAVRMCDDGSAAWAVFKVRFPAGHPRLPVTIDIDQYDGILTDDLERAFHIVEESRKAWVPTVYAVDILRRVRKLLFGNLSMRCSECGNVDCPTCGADVEEGCRLECPNCRHAFHDHCAEPIETCPWCLAPVRPAPLNDH